MNIDLNTLPTVSPKYFIKKSERAKKELDELLLAIKARGAFTQQEEDLIKHLKQTILTINANVKIKQLD